MVVFSSAMYWISISASANIPLVIIVFASALLMFLSRYIGLFGFGLLGLLGLIFILIENDVRRGFSLILVSVLGFAIAIMIH